MKPLFKATFLMFWSSLAWGDTTLILVDTPYHQHRFTGCEGSEVVIQRTGTVATIVAACRKHALDLQTTCWLPSPHPDEAPLHWETRVRASAITEPFSICTLIEYVSGPGFLRVQIECLDDPFAAVADLWGQCEP